MEETINRRGPTKNALLHVPLRNGYILELVGRKNPRIVIINPEGRMTLVGLDETTSVPINNYMIEGKDFLESQTFRSFVQDCDNLNAVRHVLES